MSGRLLVSALVALAAFVILAVLAPAAAAIGFRVAFLVAGAPVLGAVLLLTIARLTGARWAALMPLAAAAPVVAVAAIGIGVIQLAAPPPAHLGLWQLPVAVGIRAALIGGGFAWVSVRLRHGLSANFAAFALTLYAIVVTPIASDWLLGGAAGHAVSAAGMMLVAQQIGGACAWVLVAGIGDARFRRDMLKLLIAAALGLSYLIYMDFLILWYGDLPTKVVWYVDRATPLGDVAVAGALIAGLAVPMVAPGVFGGRRGEVVSGAGALVGLALIDLWWVGLGFVALIAALAAGAALALVAAGWQERRADGRA
ncbi:MAG TPA: hypothetical protein VFT56_05565 [Sphingomonas sp.]|nr:hypothetical protein [Sphingomonas sp.]